VSRYQKGKTNLDFTEARDSEWQWHQLGHMQVCISLQTDNHANTPPLSFLQAGCPSCRPINSVKALSNTEKNNCLPPRDIPTAKHFLSRQYWQLLRVNGVISHFSPFEHCCVNPWIMQRRKNPLYSTKCNFTRLLI